MGALSSQCNGPHCHDTHASCYNMDVVHTGVTFAGGTAINVQRERLLDQELLQFSRAGDARAVEALLEKRAWLETRRPVKMKVQEEDTPLEDVLEGNPTIEGMTPLMHAAMSGNLECVRTLIRAGADINAHDEDGLRPIHFAAWGNNLDVAATLLRGGADATAVDYCDRGALFYLPKDADHEIDIDAWTSLLGRQINHRELDQHMQTNCR